ncbi:MAG: hypothetical protein COV74_06020 [Candidatus Omnitrophica bacterium CG11_big_fil_rev_8_21_14_0_20_45_26]|uniref:MerC domain-containing protein n=1 Tax=Candidatus Abzuiibacterium crystallinum TaxID=1974748 RepID=A0A2H0LR11_9BACT|nr:MAG: hypothetical protein COV74_06020 [Candidatus Omnitrophica bacterium CG11_big_fil_rev_8_21_14_0_20_45_26]PIW65307.1 MAG: hypothetical protein COW12_02525 [Candidatus Omnitrophica bacterium CG12_big_fil_rev_8_21_14_0_65_45_16]
MKAKWTVPFASLLSSILAVMCPLCIPALGAFLASVGLGFALNVQFLQSLLIVLLILAVGSLAWSVYRHKQWRVLIAGCLGAVLIYIGRYVWFSQILMGSGAFLLIGVSVVNLRLKANCKQCPSN